MWLRGWDGVALGIIGPGTKELGAGLETLSGCCVVLGEPCLGVSEPPGEGEAQTSQAPSAHAETSRCETGPPPMVSIHSALI